MKSGKLLLIGVAVWAAAASAYAYRARDSAIRGWNDAIAARAELDAVANAKTQAEIELPRLRAALREMLAIRAGIEPTDGPEIIARKLTSHLHTNIDQKPNYRHTANNSLRYFLTIDGLTSNSCDTLSGTLIWMLDLFDITSRQIHFASLDFLEGKDAFATHTMIEAKAADKAIALDPTFNAVYWCAGDPEVLSGREMIECSRTGQIEVEYVGPKVLLWENNPTPLDELLTALDAADKPGAFYSYETPAPDWIQSTRATHYR